MKLSEALVLRADITKRLQRLHQRLGLSALVQEGEQPPEDPQELLAESDRLLAQLADLVDRINRTNVATQIASGRTITRALADRDALDWRYRMLQDVAKIASETTRRYSRSEIRMVSTLNVADLRRRQDAVAQERRELDLEIQAANWATELIES